MWGYHRHNVLCLETSFHQSHYKPMLVLRTQNNFFFKLYYFYFILKLITPHKCLLSFFSSFQTHHVTSTLQWDKIIMLLPKPNNLYVSYYAPLECPSALIHSDVDWLCFQTRCCTTFLSDLHLKIILHNKGNGTTLSFTLKCSLAFVCLPLVCIRKEDWCKCILFLNALCSLSLCFALVFHGQVGISIKYERIWGTIF